jgi:hypothetical protein
VSPRAGLPEGTAMTDRALLIAAIVAVALSALILSQDYPFPEAPDWQVSAK